LAFLTKKFSLKLNYRLLIEYLILVSREAKWLISLYSDSFQMMFTISILALTIRYLPRTCHRISFFIIFSILELKTQMFSMFLAYYGLFQQLLVLGSVIYESACAFAIAVQWHWCCQITCPISEKLLNGLSRMTFWRIPGCMMGSIFN